jgi:tartrate dehydrogenase/decarboxylase/D-malate dehydrogenase
MKTYRIATIPGDGIGKEVVPAGASVLRSLAENSGRFRVEFQDFGWGGDWYRRHGVMMPGDGLDALRDKDAILFGSAGDPHIPDHITLWGLRLKICQGFDQYANVRPTRILPGIESPLRHCRREDLDWVIVRENSEGEYAGVGGRAHQGHPIEVATDVTMMTRVGVERIQTLPSASARTAPMKNGGL